MTRKRRTRIPPTRRPPDERFVPETCEQCSNRRREAESPRSLDLDVLRAARIVREAVPPYGPKIRLVHRGVSMIVCPRCDSFPNPKGPDWPSIPVIDALPTRADRRRYAKSETGRRG